MRISDEGDNGGGTQGSGSYALDIWGKAQPPAGTHVETYLASRGLKLPPDNRALRFAQLNHRTSGKWPVMVALATHPGSGRPMAIQRTYLAMDGKGKIPDPIEPKKMSLGPTGGCVVRLGEPRPNTPLLIAEGIETGLSAMQATGYPAWVTLGKGTMANLELPDSVDGIILLVDIDEDGGGEMNARKAALKWKSEGRTTRLAFPSQTLGSGEQPSIKWDFNDLLRQEDGPRRICMDINNAEEPDDLAEADAPSIAPDETSSHRDEFDGLADEYADIPRTGKLRLVTAADLAKKSAPKREWFIPDFIPDHNVTELSADGGSGKSLLALQISVAANSNHDVCGLLVKQGPALVYSAEDSLEENHRRLEDICNQWGVDMSTLTGLKIAPVADAGDAALANFTTTGEIKKTPLWSALVEDVKTIRPALIVIDTRADVFGGDEIKRVQVRTFIRMLRSLAMKAKLAILMLSHPSVSGMQSGTGTSGSTGWNNGVRSRLYMEKENEKEKGEGDDEDVLVLTTKKANYAKIGSEVRIKWHKGIFVRVGFTGNVYEDKATKADRVFLDLLKKTIQQGRTPNAKKNSGDYAPSMFRGLPGSEGLTKKDFEAAMNRHLDSARVKIVSYGPPSKGLTKLVDASKSDDTSKPTVQIRVVRDCASDTACLYCHQTGDVKQIVNDRVPGCKSETLHERCAVAWWQSNVG